MLRKFLEHRKTLLFVVGMFLLGVFFAFSILVYFAWGIKGKERVNFVLLGESGPGHVGATLTDTIIFASVSRDGTVLVSVPRDLWYQPWQTKINSLYYYGQGRGDGLVWTKKILGELLGQKIDHALLIDFGVFKDLVDLVGGVDVVVERSFDDFLYPIAGRENDLCGGDPKYKCRYEYLHFEAGRQHFDGEQALKFVRSRNAEGEEGTDQARSARQQKVIVALKEKMVAPGFLLSPMKVKVLKEIFEKRVKSDLAREDWLIIGKVLLSPQARQFQSFVINNWQEDGGLIYHPLRHSSGQWILLPRDPSWRQVHRFIECLVSQEGKSSCSPEQKQETLKF